MTDTINSILMRAHASQQAGVWSDVIAELTSAIKIYPLDATLHNNLGNAYKNIDDIATAMQHYQQALKHNPHYAQAHNNIANLYSIANNYSQALIHYRACVHALPTWTQAHYNLGLFLLKHQHVDAAEKQFNNVLALDPEHLEAHFYIGVLHLHANKLETAEDIFQRVLVMQPEHSFALTNLGVLALKRDDGQLALDYFTQSLAFDKNNIDARNNIAATYMHHDRFENALGHYDVLLQHDANNIEYLYNSGVAQMALGHLPEAIVHFNTILTHIDNHFAALNNLAVIYIRLNERSRAITFLQRALLAKPQDTASQFMLHALLGDEKYPKPCEDYITNLFDNYAIQYDQHMQSILCYTLPHSMMRSIHHLGYISFKRTLDLGCGTGLSGAVLRDASEHLTGIDLSTKMLNHARKKDTYDTLVHADILTYLNNTHETFDLIVALDVLPYLGELDTFMRAVTQHLTIDGVFAFSCEISTSQSWALQANARFAHHPDYVRGLCEQYKIDILTHENLVARQQEYKDVYVQFYVTQFKLAKMEPLNSYQQAVIAL